MFFLDLLIFCRQPKTISFGCYWVGSLDFNFLIEIKLGFPLNPQKVIHFLQGGQHQPSSKRSPEASRCLPRAARTVVGGVGASPESCASGWGGKAFPQIHERGHRLASIRARDARSGCPCNGTPSAGVAPGRRRVPTAPAPNPNRQLGVSFFGDPSPKQKDVRFFRLVSL